MEVVGYNIDKSIMLTSCPQGSYAIFVECEPLLESMLSHLFVEHVTSSKVECTKVVLVYRYKTNVDSSVGGIGGRVSGRKATYSLCVYGNMREEEEKEVIIDFPVLVVNNSYSIFLLALE